MEQRSSRTCGGASLPDDLIEGILLKLPVSSLIELRYVSKKWFRLVTSQRFAVRQHSTAKDNPSPSFFIVPHDALWAEHLDKHSITPGSAVGNELSVRIDPDIRLPSDWVVHTLFSVGCGIYCFFKQTATVWDWTTFQGQNTPAKLWLWNPSTRETESLPPAPLIRRYCDSFFFGISDCEYGTFSYKIGRASIRLKPKLRYSLELYSSITRSWKRLFSSDIWFRNWSRGYVNFKGRAHWSLCIIGEDSYIKTFDYETEIFGRIHVPLAREDRISYKQFKSFVSLWEEKFLCLVLSRRKDRESFSDVWVMWDYDAENSWTKISTLGPISQDMALLGFSNKVPGMFLRKLGDYRNLFLWDCKSSDIQKITLDGHAQQYLWNGGYVLEHKESLISVINRADDVNDSDSGVMSLAAGSPYHAVGGSQDSRALKNLEWYIDQVIETKMNTHPQDLRVDRIFGELISKIVGDDDVSRLISRKCEEAVL